MDGVFWVGTKSAEPGTVEIGVFTHYRYGYMEGSQRLRMGFTTVPAMIPCKLAFSDINGLVAALFPPPLSNDLANIHGVVVSDGGNVSVERARHGTFKITVCGSSVFATRDGCARVAVALAQVANPRLSAKC